MPIYTSNFIVYGSATGMPIYANTLGMNNYSNLSVESDLHVTGDVYSTGRMDVGSTIFATLRLTSNVNFSSATNGEVFATDNRLIMDWTSTNMTGMNTVPMAVSPGNIYNSNTGVITVPTSGLYSIHLQGAFSNSIQQCTNGVYFKFLDHPNPNARIAANTTNGNIVSTSYMGFLSGGDHIKPVFFSNDANAILTAGGESYLTWMVAATFTPP